MLSCRRSSQGAPRRVYHSRSSARREARIVPEHAIARVTVPAGAREPLVREQPHAIEQTIVGRFPVCLGEYERFVDEPGQRRERRRRIAAHGRCAIEVESGWKYRDVFEQALLDWPEQARAPLNHRRERPIALRPGIGACQQVEPRVEAREDLRRTENAHLHGRQLDRERQPIEAAANLQDLRFRTPVGVESRLHCSRAQANSRNAGDAASRSVSAAAVERLDAN